VRISRDTAVAACLLWGSVATQHRPIRPRMDPFSDSHTISLERPRQVVLYALFCLILLGLSVAIPNAIFWMLSRYG
jgi:hypothetical protein